MKENGSLDRRGFLKGAALTGVGAAVAGLGLAGCAPKTEAAAGAGATASASEGAAGAGASGSGGIMPGDLDALGTPPEVSDADIAETVQCDVLVIGAGITGVAAARSAAEAGANVVVMEKNAQIEIHGFGCGVVNSTFAREQGIEVDPIEVMREYERRSYGRVNMPLVSMWANHSGEVFDWYSDAADDFVKENMTLNYYPPFEEHDTTQDLMQTFIGCIDFKEDPLKKFEVSPWLKLGQLNQAKAEAAGATFRFSLAAQRLLVDDAGAVKGAIGMDADGAYVKVEAKNGVVLTTGGFTQFGAGSEVMHKVFCPNMYKNYVIAKGEEPAWQPMFTVNPGSIQGSTGDGQLMAVWIGAEMDPFSDVGMGSCESGIGGTVALCVNQNGERFYNEDIGIWEKHDQVLRQPGRICYDIIDVNWRDRLPYQATGHRNFDYHEHQVAAGFDGITYVNTFHEEFLSAVGKPEGIVPTLDSHAGKVYGADSLEELAEIIGVPVDTFKETVARYNELVAQKKDEDFGCDPQKLFPIDTPPFFACSAVAEPNFAAYAGLKADGKLRVLNKDGKPIKGLWTAGNCCGGKFGPSYFTPLPAMNHGNGITHGYFAGLYAAEAR